MQATQSGQVNSKEARKPVATVGSVMRQCGLRVLLVPAGIAALVGLILAAPTIFGALQSVWYGWAGVITGHYTSVVPATLIEWTSIVLFIWAVCVCCKLAKVNPDSATAFGLLATVIFLLGVEVSNCALYAMVSDWSPTDVRGWNLAGLVTNAVNMGITGILAFGALMFILMMGVENA